MQGQILEAGMPAEGAELVRNVPVVACGPQREAAQPCQPVPDRRRITSHVKCFDEGLAAVLHRTNMQ